jgi:hypothetical protein
MPLRFSITRVLLSVICLIFFALYVHAQQPYIPETFTPGAVVGGCPVFPADNPWNWNISDAPVHPNSDAYIASILSGAEYLHPDFGSNPDYGIPFVVVDENQPFVPITFTAYGDESDPGPYPVPEDAPVEAGGDRHVLVIDSAECRLYEMYNSEYNGTGWNADSGAVFDLLSNRLRPAGWTSADAAGLPIFPGLADWHVMTKSKAARFATRCASRSARHSAVISSRQCIMPRITTTRTCRRWGYVCA